MENQIICCQGDSLPVGKFKLHSAFSKAMNFINPQDEILGLVKDAIDMSANSICLNWDFAQDLHELEISSETIRVQSLDFSRSEIEMYNSVLELDTELVAEIIEALILSSQLPAMCFPAKSLMALYVNNMENQFHSGFDKAFLQNAKQALSKFQMGDIIHGVMQMKGTGYGFTPSGDDFNAGFLFGLHVLEQNFDKNYSVVKHQVYSFAKGKNPLINTFLKLAFEARYFNRLKKTLFLLPGKELPAIAEAFQTLFMHGETSGADLLAGLVTAIYYKPIL